MCSSDLNNLWVDTTLDAIGGITGSGTTNYLSKFTSSSAIGNSQIYDDGTLVGVGTTSPLIGYKMTINGSLAINGGALLSDGNSVVFGSSSTLVSGSATAEELLLSAGTTSAGHILFYTGGAEKMRLNSTGLGIGTSSPIDKLTVYAAGQYPTNIGDNVYLGVANDGGSAGNMHQIGFGYNSGSAGNYYPAIIGGISESSSGQTNEGLFFATRSATTGTTRPTERMRIKSNGVINLSSVPTSSSGLSSGDIWNDGGTLKIV